MTTMVAELYDALRSAGAPDDQARAAATAIASYDQTSIEADLTMLKSDSVSFRAEFASIRKELGAMKSDLAVLKWAAGFIFAALLPLVVKAFS